MVLGSADARVVSKPSRARYSPFVVMNRTRLICAFVSFGMLLCHDAALAAESPFLYGIHDHESAPTEFLNRIKTGTGGTGGWVTATVAVGANPNDFSGADFTALANAGHTVICRINYGYFPDGTIPVPAQWDAFAIRIRNFVANSSGCTIWLIANETNLPAEWPFDSSNNRFNYISPQDYAVCFRKVADAIKSVRPNDKVLPQSLAPWAGPLGPGSFNVGGTVYPHDGLPLNWVVYLSQMLTAIAATGPVDGISLHIGSRGYTYADIHSTAKVNAGGQNLYWSLYVYKDWVDYGIPPSLYHLPIYVTECNGLYFWKGGGPPGEPLDKHYEPGWMQEIFAEFNRYNQSAATNGRPIVRCVNFYRWCAYCDGWNIDGADNPYRGQILADLDASVAQLYRWPTNVISTNPPAAPTGLTATVGNGKVTLSWSSIAFANTYTVKRATASGGLYSVIASNVTTTTYVNTSFTPGTPYFYRVTARNALGQSLESNTATATPTNGLPDVIVTAVNWSPTNLMTGTAVVFRATVKNQGSAPTPTSPSLPLGVGFGVSSGGNQCLELKPRGEFRRRGSGRVCSRRSGLRRLHLFGDRRHHDKRRGKRRPAGGVSKRALAELHLHVRQSHARGEPHGAPAFRGNLRQRGRTAAISCCPEQLSSADESGRVGGSGRQIPGARQILQHFRRRPRQRHCGVYARRGRLAEVQRHRSLIRRAAGEHPAHRAAHSDPVCQRRSIALIHRERQ